MKQSLVQKVLAAIVLFSLFVGCAAPAATPTSAPAAKPTVVAVQPTSAPTTAPTAAPTKPAAAPTATPIPVPKREAGRIILSTTTSTNDSGLLAAILPDFEKKFNVKVDVVSVGTGQAIEIGARGDVDVLLVHDRAREDKFVKDGFARERFDVMYNDYILLGPKADPAKAAGLPGVAESLKAIAKAQAPFASRGDNSGTHGKEKSLWASASITPTKEMTWYKSLGQGMGTTLTTANEMGAYTLADRGTYLSMKDKLPGLIVVMGGNSIDQNKDKSLLNPYGMMAVSADKYPAAKYDMAMNFITWMTSVDTQKMISTFGADKYGQPLFYADSAEWRKAQSGGSGGGATLKMSGKVAKASSWSQKDLAAMQTIKAKYTNKNNETKEYTGVPVSKLLELASAQADATALVFVASDGFEAEAPLADVKACAECIVATDQSSGLLMVMPGMSTKLQVKGVVEIKVK